MDYIEKIGNFNASYIDTVFGLEGYNDLYNYTSKELTGKEGKNIILKRCLNADLSGAKAIYDPIADF